MSRYKWFSVPHSWCIIIFHMNIISIHILITIAITSYSTLNFLYLFYQIVWMQFSISLFFVHNDELFDCFIICESYSFNLHVSSSNLNNLNINLAICNPSHFDIIINNSLPWMYEKPMLIIDTVCKISKNIYRFLDPQMQFK